MRSLQVKLKILFTLLLTLVLIFSGRSAYCQVDEEPPNPPVLRLVTINQVSGNTELTWMPSDSPDVAGYVIYLFKGGEGFAIDTIFNPSATFYSVLRQGTQYFSESFVVAALDFAGNVSPLSNELTTLHTEVQIDSCNRKVILSWNKYISEPVKVTGYDVLISIDGGPFTNNTHLPSDSSAFVITNFLNGAEYCIIIKALLEGNAISSSNLSCLMTRIQNPPEWINADFATVTPTGEISLEFTIDPASEIDLFSLERKSGQSGIFQQIAQIRISTGSITFNDKNADIDIVNFYRLSAINNCNTVAVLSNLASNIVLKTMGTGNEIILTWNRYKEWAGSVSGYRVYMDTGDGFTEEAQLEPGDTVYSVSVPELMFKVKEGSVCFYVNASEQSNPFGINSESSSNRACFKIDEVITVPNIFTPDGDLKNDLFRPVLTFKPDDYHLIISSRQGKVLFESRDYNESWNGTDHGIPVSGGVYIWVLKVKTPDGRNISRTGTLTLFKNR